MDSFKIKPLKMSAGIMPKIHTNQATVSVQSLGLFLMSAGFSPVAEENVIDSSQN